MLELENLTAQRNGFVLDGVSIKFRPHKITAVLGKNGSGKSTLISAIEQSINYSGVIKYLGRDLKTISARERACLVSVTPQALPVPPFTAFEVAGFGRNPYVTFTGKLSKTDIEIVENALKTVDIYKYKNVPLSKLSGGERSLSFIATALCQDARVMVFDEPTAHVDAPRESKFFSLIKTLANNKKTIIIAMHDLSLAVRYADDIAVLDGGKLVFFGSRDECVESGVIENVFGAIRKTVELDGKETIIYLSK